MTIPIVLFALAASGGLVLAFLRFTEKPLPTALAVLHGLIAASALVALGSLAFEADTPELSRVAFGLFVLAAVGGLFLFSFQLRAKPLPKAVVVGHGLTAVIAFIVLAVSAM
jgi:hypothetical protein